MFNRSAPPLILWREHEFLYVITTVDGPSCNVPPNVREFRRAGTRSAIREGRDKGRSGPFTLEMDRV